MQYLHFNGITKGCPEGQHAHPGAGNCHDITKPHKGPKANEWHRKHGLVTFDGADEPKDTGSEGNGSADEPTSESKGGSEVPPHIDYPKFKYGERQSDISTKEAEWIFNQGSSNDALQGKLDTQNQSIDKAKVKLQELPEGASSDDYYAILKNFDDLNTTVEDNSNRVGGPIRGNKKYRFANIKEMKPEIAKKTVEAFLDAKSKLYIPYKVTFGAVTSNECSGACWSSRDGSSDIRLEHRYMNQNYNYQPKNSAGVLGEMARTTPKHELTHAYINSLAYDLIAKGLDNGGISKKIGIREYNVLDFRGNCTLITHGDIPKLSNGQYLFSDENCTPSYSYVGRFTQQVVQDAKKVAKAIYGIDNYTFMSQMTIYGQTKAKEGIPEAVSDYLENGENATLANKLIYLSLQRYARFIYSDDKDIEPIGAYIKELRSKQKGNGKEKKKEEKKKDGVSKMQDYISFAQLRCM